MQLCPLKLSLSFQRQLVLLAFTLLFTAAAGAQTYTNIASGNWSAAGSWTNGSFPPTGGTNTAIIRFSPGGIDNSVNDLTGAFLLNQMLLTTAQAVNLNGNSLLFTNNGATLPQINNSSSSTLTINSAITLATNLTVIGGAITLNNPITDGGLNYSLTKNGAGTLILAATNTYSGNTIINGGKLDQVVSNSLGVGTNIIFTGSASIQPTYGAFPVMAQGVTINPGVTASLGLVNGNQKMTFNGSLTGSGTVYASDGDTSGGVEINFKNTANTFTGTAQVGGNNTATLRVNSLADSTVTDGNPIRFIATTSASGGASFFELTTGTATPLLFTNRPIELAGNYALLIWTAKFLGWGLAAWLFQQKLVVVTS